VPFHADHQPTERREATRLHVLESAIAVLARDGYAKASWRRIAEEAGVTGGVLQYHFGDKEHLLQAVVEHLSDEHVRAVEAVHISPELPLRERVALFVNASADFMSGPGEVAMLEILLAMRAPARSAVSDTSSAQMEAAQQHLWRALFPEVSQARRTVAYRLLFATLHGLEVQRLIRSEGSRKAELAALGASIAGLMESGTPIGVEP